mmetsp:Transcript_37752/g.150507  ORF Transcript_37752/g.150507 Transcript_37752/m.150507 type:complete len:161 (+) Transcript_37752:269-751(+)
MEPIEYDMGADDWELPVDADVQLGPQSWPEQGVNGSLNSSLLGYNTSYVSGLVEAERFKGSCPGASPRFLEGVPHVRGSREIRIDALGNPAPVPLSDSRLGSPKPYSKVADSHRLTLFCVFRSAKYTPKTSAETSIQKISRASSQAARNRVLDMVRCAHG